MGLYKRGEVWWYTIMRNGERKQASTGQTNKKAAALIFAEAVSGAQETKEVVEANPVVVDHSFDEFKKRYMETYSKHNKAQSSFVRDEYSFKQLDKSFSGLSLKEITPDRISEHKDRRMSEGATLGTLAKELQLLKSALNLAMREWKWIKETPFVDVKIEVPKNQIERYLTPEEETRLLSKCPDWLKEIVLFAINTGMRRNEILTLKWPQVDLDRRVITLLVTKNKEKRGVPMNATVHAILTSKVTKRKNSGYVFPSEAGTQIGPNNMERAFRKARKEAGLTDVRIHDLRHTAASRMAQAGIDLYKVGTILGHNDVRMTKRYAHLNVESLREGVDALTKPVAMVATPTTEFATVAAKLEEVG
jgi:integrase